MTVRAQRIDDFLAAAGWRDARRRPLAGDASFRHYQRLANGHGVTAVLMDAPPPHEDIRPFIRIARHLAALGLSAPRVLAADQAAGLLLLEDFGDDNMARLVDGAADPAVYYTLATDTLIALHRHPRAAAVDVPDYDAARFVEEAGLLVEWFLPAATGRPVQSELQASYRAAWQAVVSVIGAVPRSLVLRDFFPDNLMLLHDRTGVAACGLLDFQDALIGPITYDLVSLLEDARRDVPETIQRAMLSRYRAAFPALDPAAFDAAYAFCGAQRSCRIVGLFPRLWRRDGKPGYLRHLPRVWRLVERDVAHPALEPVRAWLDRHIPGELRGGLPEAPAP